MNVYCCSRSQKYINSHNPPQFVALFNALNECKAFLFKGRKYCCSLHIQDAVKVSLKRPYYAHFILCTLYISKIL